MCIHVTRENTQVRTCFSMTHTVPSLVGPFCALALLWERAVSPAVTPVLGELINPMVSTGSGKVFIASVRQRPDRWGLRGWERGWEMVLYPTSKFRVRCVASLCSLVVSPSIFWGMSRPGQTVIIKSIKNDLCFSSFQRTKQEDVPFLLGRQKRQ